MILKILILSIKTVEKFTAFNNLDFLMLTKMLSRFNASVLKYVLSLNSTCISRIKDRYSFLYNMRTQINLGKNELASNFTVSFNFSTAFSYA